MSRPCKDPDNTMTKMRISMGLTQAEFAKLLRVSASSVQAVELGKLPLSPRMQKRMIYVIEGSGTRDMLRALIDAKVAEYRRRLEAELLKEAE